jgi:hypothetical protein
MNLKFLLYLKYHLFLKHQLNLLYLYYLKNLKFQMCQKFEIRPLSQRYQCYQKSLKYLK